jgi:hypothetical protein
MEDWKGLIVFILSMFVVVVGAIFVSIKVNEKVLQVCMEDCVPSEVLEIVPVGHRVGTSYVYYLEDGRVVESSYPEENIRVGDMVCDCGCTVSKLKDNK